jgi:hypothetical protein
MQVIPQGGQRSQGVGVVGRAHEHGVQAFVVDQPTEVGEERGAREALPDGAGAALIDVAQGGDVGPGGVDGVQVGAALAGGADDADPEALAGGRSLAGWWSRPCMPCPGFLSVTGVWIPRAATSCKGSCGPRGVA